jgi:hypothetical protein
MWGEQKIFTPGANLPLGINFTSGGPSSPLGARIEALSLSKVKFCPSFADEEVRPLQKTVGGYISSSWVRPLTDMTRFILIYGSHGSTGAWRLSPILCITCIICLKACWHEQWKFVSRCVVWNHVTKIRISPNCVAMCRMKPCNQN